MPHEELCEFPHADLIEPAIFRCVRCTKAFCIDHASEVNPQKFCLACVKTTDIEVIEFPLQDKDGVRHEGRILRPVGMAFIANNKLIQDLDEEELKSFIIDYRQKLRDAEMSKNFYQISLSMAESVALDKEILKQKPSGEMYFPIQSPYAEKKPAKARARMSPEEKLLAELLRAGATPEMLKAMVDKKKKVG